MPKALNYRVGTHPECPCMRLMLQTSEKDSRQGSHPHAWTGRAMEKNWPKRSSDRQLQEAGKKTDRAITPAAEAVHVPARLSPPGSLHSRQLHQFHTQPSLGQSCHRQKMSCIYALKIASVVSNYLWPSELWPARLLCQGGRFSRQEYWSILTNTGCHTLLSSVQSLSCIWLFATPWTAAHQASLSITSFQSLLNLMSIESVMPSTHLILCRVLLPLPSLFPSIRVFSNESVLHIRWPKY